MADMWPFRASEGTLPEQAQGFFDHGAGVAGHPSPRVYVDRYRTVHAHRAPVQRAHAQLPRRTVQSHEGHHGVLTAREIPEPNRVHEPTTRNAFSLNPLFLKN